MYRKRAGFAHGQMYETKLLSLIMFRAQHDENIEEFYLGSNMEKAGYFDDICFKAKIKGYDKPLIVFIQVKHRDKDRISNSYRIDVVKYIKNYLEIQNSFNPQSHDIFFNEYIDNSECLFILYTNAKGNFKADGVKSPFANQLNSLLSTSMVDGSQLCYADEDVRDLETEFLKDEMKILARHFAKFIFTERSQMFMSDEYILRYHLILARDVVRILSVEKEYKVCAFRPDFLSTTDEYISLFREELCQILFELLQSKDNTTQESYINEFLSNPCEKTLMNVIGSVVTYKNNKLMFISKMPENYIRRLNFIYLSHYTIQKAIKTCTINKLQSFKFHVPSTFANTDLVLGGSASKIERRINYLAHYIINLIEKSNPSGIVSLDETISDGLLRLNGGLAGAVGNLLTYDDESGMLKFTDDYSLLERNAKSLLVKIKDQIDDIHKYRLEVKVKIFPKLKVYDRSCQLVVQQFLNKLLLWTDQASHEVVENILKDEIENYESFTKTTYFRIKSEAIYIKYHDNIQKWWMSPNPQYLTKHSNTYQLAVNDIISNPLIRLTSMMYMKKMTNNQYSFNDNALELFANHFSKTIQTILVTDITILTVIKVIQALSKLEVCAPVVLDLKYILEMLTDEFYALISELKNRDVKDIFIVVFDDLNNSLTSNIKLRELVKGISAKEAVIIITNNKDLSMVNQYFPLSDVLLDEKHSMGDLRPSSQSNILFKANVLFQGVMVTLAALVDDMPMKFIEGSVLRKIILNERIVIGGSLTNLDYDKMQHLFIDRKVTSGTATLEVQTLSDITDDIVLVTGKPGIGKSTFLTQLALKTKKVNYKLWIIKINFIDYVKYFNKWQKYKTLINRLEMLKFICHVVLQTIRPEFNAKISLQMESDDKVNLLDIGGDDEWATFELRLFLQFYMNTNVLFLFDGFDEISPHYTETVMTFLNVVKNDCYKNKMWVTSRSCKSVDSLLESSFATPYELECFNEDDLYVYLDKFWKTNLIFSHFDKEQIEGIKNFLDNILAENDKFKTKSNYPLICVYHSLIVYLITNFPDLDGRDRWRQLYDSIMFSLKHTIVSEGESSAGSSNRCEVKTPLLAYLSAKYYADYIKHLDDEDCETLYPNISSSAIYDQFVKTKLLKHFIHNKKVDIYNPSIKLEYDEELEKLMKLYNS